MKPDNQKKDGRKQLGHWGESVAATYLQAQGYHIVARNWRCSLGEIDLVAQAGELLVFVEVKTRRGEQMGSPEEGITPHKSRKLIETAQQYLWKNGLNEDTEWRVDLVAVELDTSGKLLRCDHVPNVVLGW